MYILAVTTGAHSTMQIVSFRQRTLEIECPTRYGFAGCNATVSVLKVPLHGSTKILNLKGELQ